MITIIIPITKRVVLFPPVQSILVWLFHIVSLIISLRVGGIPGVAIWGSSYTPWSLSMSSLLLNWYWVVAESFARSIDQKACSLSAVQLIFNSWLLWCKYINWPWFWYQDYWRKYIHSYCAVIIIVTEALLLTCTIRVTLCHRINWQW